jgi:predicted outer membrane protein
VRHAATSSGRSRPRTTLGPRQRARELRLADLRRAAAAGHGLELVLGLGGEAGRGRGVLAEHAEARHEAAVDPVLQGPHRAALRDEPPLRAERSPFAQVQEREEVALRTIGAQRGNGPAVGQPRAQPRAQVVVEHRALAHGVDARLRHPGVRHQRGAVADREQVVVALDLERAPHAHEAGQVARQGRRADERHGRGPRGPDGEVAGQPLVLALEPHGVLLDGGDPRVAAHADAAALGLAPHARRQADRCAGQHPAPLADQQQVRAVAARAQARLHGEGELGARGARAHHHDARPAIPRPLQRLLERRVEAVHEAADGSRRQRVVAHARQVEAAHARAHVEARHVVGQRRASLELEAPGVGEHTRRGGQHHARARAPRQGHHVDLQLAGRVVAGHGARDHARVDGVRAIDQQGHAHAFERVHRPAPQHLHVGVTAAHQDEVQAHGRGSRRAGAGAHAGMLPRGRTGRDGPPAQARRLARDPSAVRYGEGLPSPPAAPCGRRAVQAAPGRWRIERCKTRSAPDPDASC